MTQAVKRKVSDIVKTDLDGRFRQHLVFDPIMVEQVEQEVDEFEDEAPYIRIRMTSEGPACICRGVAESPILMTRLRRV